MIVDPWAHASFGHFGLPASSGYFRYGRVAPFADCRRFAVPSREQVLCVADPGRHDTPWYLFNPASPLRRLTLSLHGDFVAVDKVAGDFGTRALKAQPADYIRAVTGDVAGEMTARLPSRLYRFPAHNEQLPNGAPQQISAYQRSDVKQVTARAPYSRVVRAYQRAFTVPGFVYALGLIAGAAAALRRRPSADAGLRLLRRVTLVSTSTGMLLIVGAAALASYDVRYLVPTLPLVVLSAACALEKSLRLRRKPLPAQAHGADGEAPRSSGMRMTGRAYLRHADLVGEAAVFKARRWPGREGEHDRMGRAA